MVVPPLWRSVPSPPHIEHKARKAHSLKQQSFPLLLLTLGLIALQDGKQRNHKSDRRLRLTCPLLRGKNICLSLSFTIPPRTCRVFSIFMFPVFTSAMIHHSLLPTPVNDRGLFFNLQVFEIIKINGGSAWESNPIGLFKCCFDFKVLGCRLLVIG
jgi:hypothetical protein